MAIIDDGSSSTQLNVVNSSAQVILFDAAGNTITLNERTTKATTQPGIPVLGVGRNVMRLLATDSTGRLGSDTDVMQFWEPVEGATLNSQRWTTTATTMTATQSASVGITLNGSAITTINTGVLLTSQKAILRNIGHDMRFMARIRSTIVANQVSEWGVAQMGTLSGVTAQIDNGAFWRHTGGGSIVPVIAYNGSDVFTGSDISGSINSANYYAYEVVISDDSARFICYNTNTGALISDQTGVIPITQPRLTSVTHLNAWLRIRNLGSAPVSAGQVFISECSVVIIDDGTYKDWKHQIAQNSFGAEVSPTAYTQTAQFANSAWPANAVLSNTAASYTTLGGLYSVAAAVSAATDNAIFSFAVPAPYSFYCTGVDISMINTGAANAATPATTYFWGLGCNGASANLSSGGHLRIPVGFTTIPISAAIGATADGITKAFDVPYKTEAGRHITVIMRIAGGAATASQVIQGAVTIRGYFE